MDGWERWVWLALLVTTLRSGSTATSANEVELTKTSRVKVSEFLGCTETMIDWRFVTFV
jgi:hypothetical protein